MSVFRWRYDETCEGRYCCGDCDKCDKEDEPVYDLISRQAALEAITKYCIKYDLRELLADIECLPTAEKKGRWIPLSDGWAECSSCEHLERAAGLRWRYCPNCGARMEE